MELLAKTYHGLEQVLAHELRALGAKQVQERKRAVSFVGDRTLIYKVNLHVRTAIRVLMQIDQFVARTEQQLYRGIEAIDWSKFLQVSGSLAIDAVVQSPHFRHSQYAALKTKDAIVDQFRKKYKRRPSVNLENPDLRINLHISGDRCTVSLDSSGVSLHKRGYRKGNHPAHLSEVLAAGMILLSGWKGERPFIDPFCGSGTLLVEAAMILAKQAPGLLRTQYGFMRWQNYDPRIWKRLIQEAEEQIERTRGVLYGRDISELSIRSSRENLRQVRLLDLVNLNAEDFLNSSSPSSAPATLIMNPPYGERMEKEQSKLNDLYKSLGDTLKQGYEGADAWILSGNMEALKKVGLKPSKKVELYNGQLLCQFRKYELYKGKK